MIKHFFAYGTLMCDDIMEEVAGCRFTAEPGVLKGFLRRSVEGELYPGIIPRENGEVPGVVYMNVSKDAWRRLDAFEGDLYERRAVHITMPDGRSLAAATYVVRPEYASRLAPVDWRLDHFLENGKSQFKRYYRGYREIGDK